MLHFCFKPELLVLLLAVRQLWLVPDIGLDFIVYLCGRLFY